MPKIKNILIFVAIAAVLVLVYVFFIKPDSKEKVTLSSSTPTSTASPTTPETDVFVAKDFLDLLLSVKNIKLNDAILTDDAFGSLYDSSITLIPDGAEGRINPFAPLGTDPATVSLQTCALPKVLDVLTNTCI